MRTAGEVDFGYTGDDRRVHQSARRFDEPDNARQSFCHKDIVLRCRLDLLYVLVGDTHGQRSRSVYLRKGEIRTGSQLPSALNDFCSALEVPPRQVASILSKTTLECKRFKSGHRHPLTVNGIEAAYCVTHHK